ncbi:AAA domain-containing protein [Myroides injenensis]|uniref:AAA domain-containing protein n=1 Tax=Myroides injenensis TaxID=1183151 RepID=UPI00028A3FD8|nr:AAA domain-containing protein [Myroides injenensis]
MFGFPSSEMYFNTLISIYNNCDKLPLSDQYDQLYKLIDRLSKQVVKNEKAVFSNLFSRLSFICSKYKVSKKIHDFRIYTNELSTINIVPSPLYFPTYWMDSNEFVSQVFNVPIPDLNRSLFPTIQHRRPQNKSQFSSYIEKEKVTFLYKEDDFLICLSSSDSNSQEIKVKINDIEINNTFSSVNKLWPYALLYLVGIGIDNDGIYYPKIIVLEPDYLLDVSSIAECFQDFGSSPLHFLRSKFEEVSNSKYLLIGNFANLVIDELIGQDKNNFTVDFNQVFLKHFQNAPLEHLFCNDIKTHEDFLLYAADCEKHFDTIKKVVLTEFPTYGISDSHAIALEPSFLNNTFGIQGRLDILHHNQKSNRFVIVELKSGSGPYPDTGVNVRNNHSAQLFMYFLRLSQTNNIALHQIGDDNIINGFIFYSKVHKGNLRSDHINMSRIQEICEMRNKIIINEHILQEGTLYDIANLLQKINVNTIVDKNTSTKFKELLHKQYQAMLRPLITASGLEQVYFLSFVQFIANEQRINKYGDNEYDSGQSLASLWNKSFKEKLDSYSILYNLEIKENHIHSDEKSILFKRNTIDSFASFREGEICILYPFMGEYDNATNHQVFKCNIKSIKKDTVEVIFRYKQNNVTYFNRFKYWALERDFMDSSFQSMYKGLFTFINSPQRIKNLLLTIEKPEKLTNYGFKKEYLSSEQNTIINNALSAKDYFILNGPPGTGKTSHIIKELISELYNNTSQNILLLAYTNKAIDELCYAICDTLEIDITTYEQSSLPFIRLGHRLSSDINFRPFLLNEIIEQEKRATLKRKGKFNRDSLRKIIDHNRIYIATVATASANTDLLRHKKFDVAIIDEASQILEPQIIGILAQCHKFIMIGDHKQLPAIVLQSEENTKTKNTLLEEIGLYNKRNSLFERLFNYCEKNHLDYAYDTLTYQGRMHREIASFPNIAFYDGKLKEAYWLENLTLDIKNHLQRQVVDFNYKAPDDTVLTQLLSKERMIFLNVKNNIEEQFAKTSIVEAKLVCQIIKTLQRIYSYNNRSLNISKQIGIIAPFKNQIALIKQELETHFDDECEHITVDTVERFQGGQRDIIIYSLTVNNVYQLASLINLNDTATVDRKLNVALTRAKEQIIILGNESIITQNEVYDELIKNIYFKGNAMNVDNNVNNSVDK